MTDTQGNEDNAAHDWLTPKEIEQKYGVKLRQVYRWVEHAQVNFERDKSGTRVDPASIEKQLRSQNVQRVIADVISESDRHDSQSGQRATTGELKTGLALQVITLTQERDKLQERIYELERGMRDASFERGRLESLEQQLSRMEGDRGGLVKAIALLFVLLVIALVALVVLVLVLKV